MPTALFVSPHLDDVAFSCGGTLTVLGRRGWRTVLVTAFTASVAEPTGFALACQLDKGLGADVDYMALRRAEDEAFAFHAGVHRMMWLDLCEAPHRGYESAPELFGATRADDDAAAAITAHLATIIEDERPDVVFGPQALGNHVDHRAVVSAVCAAVPEHSPIHWYRDAPYVIRDPGARPPLPLRQPLVGRTVPIGSTIGTKISGALAYRTQVGFQFGGELDCASMLHDLAAAEGWRAGLDEPAEAFLVTCVDSLGY